MGIGDRINRLENYYHPDSAGGTPRKIPEPTDEDLIEIVSTFYEARGHNVEVFARGIGMDREEAEEVIAIIRERRRYGIRSPQRLEAQWSPGGVAGRLLRRDRYSSPGRRLLGPVRIPLVTVHE